MRKHPSRSKATKSTVIVEHGFIKAHSEAKTADAFLLQAAKHMQDRAATYDSPEGERSMNKTVQIFNLYAGTELKESDGWLFMEILKNVRQLQCKNFHRDSAEDGIAYSSLKAEAWVKEA